MSLKVTSRKILGLRSDHHFKYETCLCFTEPRNSNKSSSCFPAVAFLNCSLRHFPGAIHWPTDFLPCCIVLTMATGSPAHGLSLTWWQSFHDSDCSNALTYMITNWVRGSHPNCELSYFSNVLSCCYHSCLYYSIDFADLSSGELAYIDIITKKPWLLIWLYKSVLAG